MLRPSETEDVQQSETRCRSDSQVPNFSGRSGEHYVEETRGQSCDGYRWFAGHRRRDRETSCCQWRKRGPHLREGWRGGGRCVQAIESHGGKAVAFQAEATNAKAVGAAVDKAVAALGRLDVLVNNAGTAIPNKFEDATLEELDRVIDINTRGTFITNPGGAQAHEQWRPYHHDRLVRRRAHDDARSSSLLGDQGGSEDVHQGLSREVGDRRITVNNIQPEPIDTDLNPAAGRTAVPQLANTALKRYGHVEEVAALVAFVASPEAAYVTGASLTVDGGTNA